MWRLHEYFALFHKAELVARPLLDSFVATFEIAHLRFLRGVTHFQRLIHVTLGGELILHVAHPEPTALAEPQWKLQRDEQDDQHPGGPLHSCRLLAQVVEGIEAGVDHGIAQIFFDAQQLVVLGDTVGAR